MINRAPQLDQLNLLTTAQLRKQLKSSLAFAKKYPEFKYGWHNEYIEHMKTIIASRIGK